MSNNKKNMILGFMHAETPKYRSIYSLTYLLVKAAFFRTALREHHNMKTYTELKK